MHFACLSRVKRQVKSYLPTEMTVIKGFIPYTFLNDIISLKFFFFSVLKHQQITYAICSVRCLTVFINFSDTIFPTTYLEFPTTLRPVLTEDTVIIFSNGLTL